MKRYQNNILLLFGFFGILLPLQLFFKISLEEPYPSFNFPGFASLPVKEERYITFTKTTAQVFFKDGTNTVLVKNSYLGEKIPRTIQVTLIKNLLFPKEYPILDARINSLPAYKKELYLLKKSILNRNIKKVNLEESKAFVIKKLKENFPDKEVTEILVTNENKDFDIATKQLTNRITKDTLINFKF
ncbi:hypothetical protein MTQ00_13085 [Chryseobacterium sp. B21-037]|uniref:hypothetical protein n=2 Tax=Chryseobacterium TaxID=59732 RepID=UPI002359B10D|nr:MULTISPECIES: hypothetical protein [unclassified Chryseobacterium]MDC8105478.1 hypothetical protein [Chryseobacterium sp. B21-037]MDQ1805733.1 hypothetical protein [Chryseobacterium sp. CKR4-1]